MTAPDLIIAIVPLLVTAAGILYLRREGRKIDAAQAERRRLRAKEAATPEKPSEPAYIVTGGIFRKAHGSNVKAAIYQRELVKRVAPKLKPRANA